MKGRITSSIGLALALVLILSACSEIPYMNDQKQIYVGPILVECEGTAPQLCMLVKENVNEPYTLFYDQIEGFTHEPGYVYTLYVALEPIDDPPADGPSVRTVHLQTPNKQSVSSPLDGSLWKLQSYRNSQGEEEKILPDTEITARFRVINFGGTAGCNSYYASYTVDEERLYIGVVGATGVSCEDPAGVMDQESEYLSNLRNAHSFVVEDEVLTITNADGDILLSYQAVKSEPLVGTKWLLTGINRVNTGFSSLLTGTSVDAVFREGGVLDGRSGCNQYTAPYQVAGEQISIGESVKTRQFCGSPEGIMVQENLYLGLLQSASTYQIYENSLIVLSENGQVLLGYVASEEPVEEIQTEEEGNSITPQ